MRDGANLEVPDVEEIIWDTTPFEKKIAKEALAIELTFGTGQLTWTIAKFLSHDSLKSVTKTSNWDISWLAKMTTTSADTWLWKPNGTLRNENWFPPELRKYQPWNGWFSGATTDLPDPIKRRMRNLVLANEHEHLVRLKNQLLEITDGSTPLSTPQTSNLNDNTTSRVAHCDHLLDEDNSIKWIAKTEFFGCAPIRLYWGMITEDTKTKILQGELLWSVYPPVRRHFVKKLQVQQMIADGHFPHQITQNNC